MHTVKDVLYGTAFRKIDVDNVLDPDSPSWVRFDPVLGYVPDDIAMKDGEGSRSSIYTFEPTGERKIVNGAGQPCRINTYGDSFTMCQQVSDGETWQEYLASHLGEPIRNFGNGGYSVYVAYRRALRMEATECSGEYVILGIYDDDHIRSLDAARWIRTEWPRRNRRSDGPRPMHGLPWAHVRYDLEKGRFVEKDGICTTPDDLRALCDPECYYETFKDDQIARIFTLRTGGHVDKVDDLQALAEAFGVEVDLTDPDRRAADAARLHLTYGLKSTEFILDEMRVWAEAQRKKLMILLFYADSEIPKLIRDNWRLDETLVDYLNRNNVPYVDVLRKHAIDYASMSFSYDDYIARYYVKAAGAAVFGHYSAVGNFFAAMNIKDEVVAWLDPKPPTYRGG
ncbi:MAG TPA: hypothetical protein VFJ30_11360 [Phycisphaerae bacterium]|nr:hypothetical protein [Phycisphaerae bacterium]